MERLILKDLLQWKKSKHRKPLILKGVRQVGKTWVLKESVAVSSNALNTLKYFCENAPEYHVACAGSLLGIALAKPVSFPVGKVDFLEIGPMTFTEFLMANGDGNLAAYWIF